MTTGRGLACSCYPRPCLGQTETGVPVALGVLGVLGLVCHAPLAPPVTVWCTCGLRQATGPNGRPSPATRSVYPRERQLGHHRWQQQTYANGRATHHAAGRGNIAGCQRRFRSRCVSVAAPVPGPDPTPISMSADPSGTPVHVYGRFCRGGGGVKPPVWILFGYISVSSQQPLPDER